MWKGMRKCERKRKDQYKKWGVVLHSAVQCSTLWSKPLCVALYFRALCCSIVRAVPCAVFQKLHCILVYCTVLYTVADLLCCCWWIVSFDRQREDTSSLALLRSSRDPVRRNGDKDGNEINRGAEKISESKGVKWGEERRGEERGGWRVEMGERRREEDEE